jgi:hypothetical protein
MYRYALGLTASSVAAAHAIINEAVIGFVKIAGPMTRADKIYDHYGCICRGTIPNFHGPWDHHTLLRYEKKSPKCLVEYVRNADGPMIVEITRHNDRNPIGQLMQCIIALEQAGIAPSQVKFAMSVVNIYLSGVNIFTPEAINAFLSRFPIKWIGVIYLSGLHVESNRRAAFPGEDNDIIWGPLAQKNHAGDSTTSQEPGYCEFVTFARQNRIPIVLENRAIYDINLVRQLIAQCGWIEQTCS